ncbi:AP-5 complex subunit mu-1 isoform X4 [Hydra vulgaris]|uniref:AP-5 complex subunit mu-1 n=1 Tax=Hydra vulgaris TaxID=6087 RepID=A0ABM4CJZ2_HYDVU
MAFRAVYVISSSEKDFKGKPKIVFKRKFPVVESKHKLVHGSMYLQIPTNIATLVMRELNENQEKSLKMSHNCISNNTAPVFNFVKEKLNPVVAFQKDQFIYSCIVSDESNDFFSSSGVLMAVVALEGMSAIMENSVLLESIEERINYLHHYVLIGFPFGIPVELNVNTIFALLSTVKSSTVLKSKAPIWRPVIIKGKQTIQLTIKESVKALQFDKNNLADVHEIFGTVYCKADLEEAPDITLSLQSPLNSDVFSQMTFHSCVKQVDELTSGINRKKDDEELVLRKVRFCPPYEAFPLCHYVTQSKECPIKVSFKMKGISERVNILIQIFLEHQMKNSFDFFNVNIPFFNRGAIANVEATPKTHVVTVSENKSELLWCIGNKFIKRNQYEASLELFVSFSHGQCMVKDQFLIGENSYIKVCFKTRNFTYSRLNLEGKSIEIYPNSKAKITTASEFESQEFKVWNSCGEVTDSTFT